MNTRVVYAFISLALVILQTTIGRLVSLGGIIPDMLVIWVAYLAIKEGQLRGTVWGFSVGLFSDFLAADFLGLSALSKTLAGFTAGYFFNQNTTQQTLGSYRFPLIVVVVSLVHNAVYFLIFTLGTDIHFWQTVLRFGITTTLYTATVSLLPMFILQRKLSP